MPIYEYQCSDPDCRHEFDELQSMSEPPLVTCPKCGKDTLKKLIGSGAGLIFKGSGFYLTDYKNNKTSGSPSKEGTSKETGSKEAGSKEGASKEPGSKENSSKKETSSKSEGSTKENGSLKESGKTASGSSQLKAAEIKSKESKKN